MNVIRKDRLKSSYALRLKGDLYAPQGPKDARAGAPAALLLYIGTARWMRRTHGRVV